jgi:hypothetical protein
LEKFKLELMQMFTPIEWVVDEICLISRDGSMLCIHLASVHPFLPSETPFEVKFTVPLSDGAPVESV